MKRVIFTVGWQEVIQGSGAGEFTVIHDPLPVGRRRALSYWQRLAARLDVELSASWLIVRSPQGAADIPPDVRNAFQGVTAAETFPELGRAVRRVQSLAARSRVVTDFDVIARRCNAMRGAGRRIAFTNGVFDLFHVGHLRLLRAARAQGDALVVGINSDESARGLKGRSRPVVPQYARAELVAAVREVDFCAIFDQEDPLELLRVVRPDILVKGSEYALSAVVGRGMVERWGGRVVLAPHLEAWSSTEVIRRLRRRRA